MFYLKNIFVDFLKEEKGQTLVEWIAILAFLLVIIMVSIKLIGQKGKEKSDDILRELS
jgi:Flp pilus assembly pilin Flp